MLADSAGRMEIRDSLALLEKASSFNRRLSDKKQTDKELPPRKIINKSFPWTGILWVASALIIVTLLLFLFKNRRY